jgi:LytS/YehU family sensor histidine kinase
VYGTLLLISLGASLLIIAIGEIFFAEQARLRRQVSVTAAELAQLRSQVSPHFLFNALNSLYTAAWKEKSEKTADGIQRLGDMMRFMLQENNKEWIALDKELAYLHNYIHIQRIRIDESGGIDIRIHIEQQEREAVIAPMMLVPFVENAFKHGLSHLNPSWIWVTLSFDATGLYLKVQNSCHSSKETNPGQEQSGIGLDNVKRRLELIYPGKHTLAITKTAKDYVAELTLILW